MKESIQEIRVWDDPSLDKAAWGEGEWLNEPDKVQFIAGIDAEGGEEGYRCLALRNHTTGSWCGYVEVDYKHPAYGLSCNGIDNLLEEVSQAQFREVLHKWYKAGYKGLPPTNEMIELPDPSEVGKAIIGIRVHGGLTFGGSPSSISPGMWQHVQSQFEKAREQAATHPIGDAVRWLHKWEPAEHDYEAFKAITTATCICFEPPDNEAWLFGFDTSHSFDLMPAMQAFMKKFRFGSQEKEEKEEKEEKWKDVYRNLTYVEGECLSLANQLKEMEMRSSPRSSSDSGRKE